MPALFCVEQRLLFQLRDAEKIDYGHFLQLSDTTAGGFGCANYHHRFWSEHRLQCRAATAEEITLPLSSRARFAHNVQDKLSFGFAVAATLRSPGSLVRQKLAPLALMPIQ
jgi:hypothetical protein